MRAHKKDKAAARARSPFDYTACLYTMHAAILAAKGLEYTEENRKKLRVTIHRVDEAKEKVVQLVDYVGDDTGGAGREFSSRSGVIGRALISPERTALMDRPESNDDYIKALQIDWHMPREEALRLSMGRFSLMAVAILGQNNAIGVVYLDSSERGFFDQATCEAVVAACGAMPAQYTKFKGMITNRSRS